MDNPGKESFDIFPTLDDGGDALSDNAKKTENDPSDIFGWKCSQKRSKNRKKQAQSVDDAKLSVAINKKSDAQVAPRNNNPNRGVGNGNSRVSSVMKNPTTKTTLSQKVKYGEPAHTNTINTRVPPPPEYNNPLQQKQLSLEPQGPGYARPSYTSVVSFSLPNANAFNYPQLQQPQNPWQKNNNYYQGNGPLQRFASGRPDLEAQCVSGKTRGKAIDKRNGSDAHNNESLKQDAKDIKKSVKKFAAPDRDPETNCISEQHPTNESPQQMTLDEWKAQNKNRVKPQFNIRKAGEGEDINKWNKMVKLNNKKKTMIAAIEEKDCMSLMSPQRPRRFQRLLNVEFNFIDKNRDDNNSENSSSPDEVHRQENPPLQLDLNGTTDLGNTTQCDTQVRGLNQVPKVDDKLQFPTLTELRKLKSIPA